jgi:hypothetical protein
LNFSIPYWPKRRYLTGIDWVMGALDYVTRQTTGMGNFSQVVLELDGLLPEQSLQSILDQLSHCFPLIHGHPARDVLNLAPFWKIPRKPPSIPLRIVALPANSDVEVNRLLENHANQPFDDNSQHIRCLLIHVGQQKSLFATMFDHRLFDAIGAETFLRLIDQTAQGKLDAIAPQIKVAEPAHLDHWPRRLQSGKKLNAFLYRLAERPVSALSMPPKNTAANRSIRWVHDSLTVEQSAQFNRQAAEEISIPILLPSATARAILALQQALPSMPLPGEQHLAFTSTSARSLGREWETLFFNHFSFLIFSAEKESPKSAAGLAVHLRNQFFEQMKENIPAALQDASALIRICPHWLSSKFMRRIFQGRICSLYFACLRETGYPETHFLGLPILNLTHMTPAISPPGLNLCMTYHANRFHLVLSYLDGALDPVAAQQIMQNFKSLLITENEHARASH